MTRRKLYGYKKVQRGDLVGRLIVGEVCGKSKNGSYIWSCLCECGNKVEVISSSLNNGLTRSCGCLYDEIKGKQTLKHGRRYSREYNSWTAMKQRCYYRNHTYYANYGGRGISVCERWKSSFENFYEDMGDCPQGMTLDRIDNDGNYEAKNCRWATQITQSRNTGGHKNSTSGYKGVSYHSKHNKWQVSIGLNGESIYLGVFENLEEALQARQTAEELYWNE